MQRQRSLLLAAATLALALCAGTALADQAAVLSPVRNASRTHGLPTGAGRGPGGSTNTMPGRVRDASRGVSLHSVDRPRPAPCVLALALQRAACSSAFRSADWRLAVPHCAACHVNPHRCLDTDGPSAGVSMRCAQVLAAYPIVAAYNPRPRSAVGGEEEVPIGVRHPRAAADAGCIVERTSLSAEFFVSARHLARLSLRLRAVRAEWHVLDGARACSRMRQCSS
jgi:hypothetical protein